MAHDELGKYALATESLDTSAERGSDGGWHATSGANAAHVDAKRDVTRKEWTTARGRVDDRGYEDHFRFPRQTL